MTTDEA